MKKKLLSLIAVSAALATAGSTLVACGDKGGNGGANATVTKEQWEAALSLSSFESNFKLNVKTVNETSKMSEEFTFLAGSQKYGDYSMTAVRMKEDVKRRESATMRIVGAEKDAYYDRYSRIEQVENEDGEWVDGDWKEGKWTVAYEDHITPTDEQWTSRLENVGLVYAFKFADKYDSFEYKNGAYVLKGDKGIIIEQYTYEPDPDYPDYGSYSYTVTATKVTVKFDGAKLSSVEITMVNHYEEETEDGEPEITETMLSGTFKLSYGTQTITPPEDAVPDGEDE